MQQSCDWDSPLELNRDCLLSSPMDRLCYSCNFDIFLKRMKMFDELVNLSSSSQRLGVAQRGRIRISIVVTLQHASLGFDLPYKSIKMYYTRICIVL